MARAADRIPDNAPGDVFVDTSCIDCDLCRQLAPATFARSGAAGQSFVVAQPRDEASARRAALALVACPTASIGAARLDVRSASRAFPEPIEGAADVLFCGYASARSYGASSYLVVRPADRGGNVLVDSPRIARPLVEQLRALGGVSTMFLTHRDDVADHALFREAFGCVRVIHRRDLDAGTRDVEHVLEGDAPIALDDELLALPVPGHTAGSTALLLRDETLFTGDHLWWSDERRALHASRGVCWWSWAAQTRSMATLLDRRFTRVLPGHGRRHLAATPEAMRADLAALVAWMEARP